MTTPGQVTQLAWTVASVLSLSVFPWPTCPVIPGSPCVSVSLLLLCRGSWGWRGQSDFGDGGVRLCATGSAEHLL